MTHRFETSKDAIYDAYMDMDVETEEGVTERDEAKAFRDSSPEPAPAKKSTPKQTSSVDNDGSAANPNNQPNLYAWAALEGNEDLGFDAPTRVVEPIPTVSHEITDSTCACGESVEPLLPADRASKLRKVARMFGDNNEAYVVRFALFNSFDACLSVHQVAQFFVDAGLNVRRGNKPMSFVEVLEDTQRLVDKSRRKRSHSGHYGCTGPATKSLLTVGVSDDKDPQQSAAKSKAPKKGQRRAYATQRVFAGLDMLKVSETLLGHRSAESIGARCVNAFNIMLSVFGPHMSEGRVNIEIFHAYVADLLGISANDVRNALTLLRDKKIIILKRQPRKSGEASVYTASAEFCDETLSNLLKAVAKEYGVAQDEKVTLAYNYLNGAVQVVDYATKSKAVYGDVYRNCKWRAETLLVRFGHYVGLDAQREVLLNEAPKSLNLEGQYVATVRGIEVEVEREAPRASDYLKQLARQRMLAGLAVEEFPSYSVDNPNAYLDDLDFDTPHFTDEEVDAAFAEAAEQEGVVVDQLVSVASVRVAEDAETAMNNGPVIDNANIDVNNYNNNASSNRQVNKNGRT